VAFVLAIEPDRRQAAILSRVVRHHVHADFAVVDSHDAALAILADRLPDLLLLTALLSPRDEDELVAHLRRLDEAAHVQTLRIPLLADDEPDDLRGWRRGWRAILKRRAGRPRGCDPEIFASEVRTYLERAADLKAERAATVAEMATAALAAPAAGPGPDPAPLAARSLQTSPAPARPVEDTSATEAVASASPETVDDRVFAPRLSSPTPGALTMTPAVDPDDHFFSWRRPSGPQHEPRATVSDAPSGLAASDAALPPASATAAGDIPDAVDSIAEVPRGPLGRERIENAGANFGSIGEETHSVPPPVGSTAGELAPALVEIGTDEDLGVVDDLELIEVVDDDAPPAAIEAAPRAAEAGEADAYSWLLATIRSLRHDLTRSRAPRAGAADSAAPEPPPAPSPPDRPARAEVPDRAAPAEPRPLAGVSSEAAQSGASRFEALDPAAPPRVARQARSEPAVVAEADSPPPLRDPRRQADPDAIREADLRRLPPLLLEQLAATVAGAPRTEAPASPDLADLLAALNLPTAVALVTYPRDVCVCRITVTAPPSGTAPRAPLRRRRPAHGPRPAV
jgi:hypothetical protein